MKNVIKNSAAILSVLVLGMFATTAHAESTYRIWNFTLPSSSTGSWSANEYNEGVAVSGTFERQSVNSFVKLTVGSSSGNFAPVPGSIKWGLEIPGFTFFVEPTMTSETRLISTVVAGVCPTSPWSGNFGFISIPSTGFNMNADTPAFGKFTWTPSTNTLRINNIYKMSGYTSLATNVDISGTCSNGRVTLSGTGDRSGTLQISANAGSIYTINSPASGKITYASPDVAIPSVAIIAGDYSAIGFDHESPQSIISYRMTLNGTNSSAQFRQITNFVDNSTNNNGWNFSNISINTPSDGMFTATISSVASGVETTYGSNNEVICFTYLAQKNFISCLAKYVGVDSSKPINFVMVSDTQANAAATLDAYNFGSGTGKVITSMGSYYGSLNAMTLTPEGKIVGAGYAYTTQYDHAVVRYEANGSLDANFGSSGKFITTAVNGTFEDRAFAVALQSDGKIVTAGLNANLGGSATNDPVVMRLTTAGALDTTFGSSGVFTASIGSTQELTYGVAIQSDGKIVIGGSTGNGSVNDFHLMRFTTAGAIDSTFDSDGRVITTFAHGFQDLARAVAIQSDAKIVAGGYVYNSTWHYEFAATRYLTSGALDTSFSGDGKVEINFGAGADQANAMAIQPDGKIVLAGSENSELYYAIARLNSDGTLDTSFSGDGKFSTTLNTTSNGLYAVAIQGDGKIVAVGKALVGSYTDFAVLRLNSAGTLDGNFSTDGKHTFAGPSGADYTDYANAVAIQNDRKIVIGGSVMENNAVYDNWGVTRFWGSW